MLFWNRQNENEKRLIERLERIVSEHELAVANLKSAVAHLKNAETVEQFTNLAHDAVESAEIIESQSPRIETLIDLLNNIWLGIQSGQRDFRLQARQIAKIADELVQSS